MKHKTAIFTKALICFYASIGLVVFHSDISEKVFLMLKIWSKVLIPSLFPYLVLCTYITSSGILSVLSPLRALISKVFNISCSGADVYLCSLISGYPSGAMCANELYKAKRITKEEALRLICYTNNASPLFLICGLGGGMLSCAFDGFLIYIIQTVSSAVFGICAGAGAARCTEKERKTTVGYASVAKCTQKAVETMLTICGYIILATVAGEIICQSLEQISGGNAVFRCCVFFLLEITNAASLISQGGQSPFTFAVLCALASWSGLCVIMQIKASIDSCFDIKRIVISRLWQSCMSFGMGFLSKSFFTKTPHFGHRSLMAVSLVASIVIFVCYMAGAKRKRAIM